MQSCLFGTVWPMLGMRVALAIPPLLFTNRLFAIMIGRLLLFCLFTMFLVVAGCGVVIGAGGGVVVGGKHMVLDAMCTYGECWYTNRHACTLMDLLFSAWPTSYT